MVVPVTLAYYPLFLIVSGIILNSLTFIILCRRRFRGTKKQPTIHYMRTIAVFDVLALFGWNLQHYLVDIHGYSLETKTVSTCKFFSFFGYFTVQTTAWLRVFISLDRYLYLSRLNKTWFSHQRNVLLIIMIIIITLIIFNLHLMIFGCFELPNGDVSTNAPTYQIFPLWDYINLGVYNFGPFILMMIFNIGIIYHLFYLRRTTTVRNSRIQHRSISIALLTTTFLFLLMTLPASIVYGFFCDVLTNYSLHLVDTFLFTYHILSFPSYIITFKEFRQEFIALILSRRHLRRIQPTMTLRSYALTVGH